MYEGNAYIPWILSGIGLLGCAAAVWISAVAKPRLDSAPYHHTPLEPETTRPVPDFYEADVLKAVLDHQESLRKSGFGRLRVVQKYEHFE